MAIDDNTSYELTGLQVKDLASKIRAKANTNSLATVATTGDYGDLLNTPTIPAPYTLPPATTSSLGGVIVGNNLSVDASGNLSATDTTYSDFTGATSSAAGTNGLVPAPSAGDEGKALHGDGTWKDTTAKLVEMSYGESNAWAKFIAAYNAGSIVYCRASSNSNPASGSQTRKAFMAYVNNATSPTSVEFQYVRSVSSKTDSQQGDQVFVYTLTNASGGTWSVASRNMAPKINVSGPITKTFTNGANASIAIGANAMTGATSSAAGSAGVVPAPASGDQDKVLTGAGTWVDMAGSYSTSEVATPFTWIDGKTIYKKTVDFGALPSSNTKTVAHNITGMTAVIKIEGIIYTGAQYNDYTPVPLVSPSASNLVSCSVNLTNIKMETSRDKSAMSAYVTIYYTK